MASVSYAKIASLPPPAPAPAPAPVTAPGAAAPAPAPAPAAAPPQQTPLTQILELLETVTTVPEALIKIMNAIRGDMEIIPSGQGMRNLSISKPEDKKFIHQGLHWRSGGGYNASKNTGAFDTRQHNSQSSTSPLSKPTSTSRYQSKFKKEGEMNDKILNNILGNKLNSFTKLTYNDTRDFIYQIMDSGETEFIRDFIEKVFFKATLEDLYCALFAQLIAEIAQRYPVMYEEMNKYHSEFLKVFDTVEENIANSDSNTLAKQRQYRLGYGQFISELAGQNALDKEQLIFIMCKLMENIWNFSVESEKINSVEESIDCLVRLSKSLSKRSPDFFKDVKEKVASRILENLNKLIQRTAGERPSLTSKARFALMDLKDILV